MALKDGLCLNCGSLMRVNTESESTTCIFCWASSASDEAIDLLGNSDDYEFPNETFAEPDDAVKSEVFRNQSLGGVVIGSPKTSNNVSSSRNTKGKLTPKEKVALQNKPIVKPYVSKRHKVGILIGLASFIIILAAIGTPTYFLRENKKAAIVAALPDFISFTNDKNNFDIQRQDNHLIYIVSPKEVTESEAVDVFDKYAKIYSDVYNIDIDAAKNKVEVKLVDSVNGGFSINSEDGETKAINLNKIVEIPVDNEDNTEESNKK